MTQEANPWLDGADVARSLDAARAPFYGTVVAVADPFVVVIPDGQPTSIECDASTEVIASAAPGDTVWCIPTGGRVFVAAIKAS